MSDLYLRLRCDRHIAELTHRIAELKKAPPSGGSEKLASAELIELLQKRLESWQERKKMLAGSSPEQW
jgi:hypothetical protein